MANKKKNVLFDLLSLITYKKPVEAREFYIPEVDKEPLADTRPEKKKDPKEKPASENGQKGLKKPIPAAQRTRERLKKNAEPQNPEDKSISKSIDRNIEFIKKSFNAAYNKDIILREFTVAGKFRAFIAFIDGMVDRITINEFILRPLLSKESLDAAEGCSLEYILEKVLETNQAVKKTEPDEVIYEILQGNTCLYVDGCNFYLSSETKGYDKRSVEKPQTEGVVRGAQEGFNENLRTNITLIRKIIKNKDLSTEFVKIGDRNNNLCAILYIKGLTNPAIVHEVKRRIGNLKTDFIAGSGMLEQFIEENSWSLVPTILSTERPDRTASHLVEGKVVIIAEGTPFALVVPVSLLTMFHTPEDTVLRWQYGTLLRIIRLFATFIAVFAPGLYVAITNFHREMIPTDLLIAIAKARENVPFPTIIEVLLMEISFELIREAGIRIPGIIGNTIGIIGALILGQAAVQANLVSPVMIIIVAITGLGNFAIPDFSVAFAARIYRIIFIILGASLGFYGISLGIVALTTILACTKSFGVPLLSFIAPKVRSINDMILRKPVWMQERRPDNVNPLDETRQPKISRKWMLQDAQVSPKGNQGDEKKDE